MRSEFSAVGAGFDKLPGTLTPNKAVVINAGGTGMTVTTGSLALAGDFSTTGAFNTILVQQASVTLTLPAANDNLVGRATTDTLTNKSISGSTNTLTNIGNAALTNSSVTIGSTSVALGATAASISGLSLVAPALGTPASGVLTNCTGLPVSTGVSGLGANVAAFLATPSSANLAAAVTDETGTGSLVLANAPTLVNPVVGTQVGSDNSTKAASTAFVQALAILAASFAGSAVSLSGTGYVKLPCIGGPFIFQWGFAGGGGSNSIALPITFPNNIQGYQAVGCESIPGAGGASIFGNAYANSNSNIGAHTNNVAYAACWFAWGN